MRLHTLAFIGRVERKRHGEQRHGARRLRRVVRLRSAGLCALLVCGGAIARHPETVLGRFGLLPSDSNASPYGPSIDALVQEVEAAAAAGHESDVQDACARLIAQYPDHPMVEPAYVRLVQGLVASHDYSGAQRTFDAFRTLHPQSTLLPEALLDMAGWQYEIGRYEQAARGYTDLVAMVTNASFVVEIGEDTAPQPILWRSQRLWKEHQRRLRSRTQLERLARFNQALCYEQGGNAEAALRAYERFRARFPADERSAEANFHEAALHVAVGRNAEALEHFIAAAETASAPVALRSESLYRAGLLLQAGRRNDEAIAIFRRVQSVRPTDDTFRIASLAALAQLLEDREPLRALDIYREIADCATQPAMRAVALERLSVLERDSAVAAAAR